jgi:hypothetical protein
MISLQQSISINFLYKNITKVFPIVSLGALHSSQRSGKLFLSGGGKHGTLKEGDKRKQATPTLIAKGISPVLEKVQTFPGNQDTTLK